MEKIIIVSPTDVATGGTELLQQLCYKLRMFGKQSFMYYIGEFDNSPVQNRFSEYENPRIEMLEDVELNLIIIPETLTSLLRKYKKAECYLWWLSVDNYFGALKNSPDLIHRIYHILKDKRNSKYFKKCHHLIQSQYAREYLENRNITDIQWLSDYLNRGYLNKAKIDINLCKKNNILFNPKKGMEFTKKIMQQIPEYNWIPLQNLTVDEMINIMHESKLYIDFGNHPGKDRIPREAAICGCCIITGRNGAAKNDIDIMIDEQYKFDNKEKNISAIHKEITDIMENYDCRNKDFDLYRERINGEEEQFEQDIKKIFGIEVI